MIRSLAILLVLAASVHAEDDTFFESKIRPVLVEHCFSCHSSKAKKVKGGLLLDSRESMLKGGDTGPAVVSEAPEKSLLLDAISYRNVDLTMPPKGKLPDAVVADFSAWVKKGAPWPSAAAQGKVARADAFDLEKRKRDHWAWQPIRSVAPPPGPHASLIDRFLLQKMREKALQPASDAEPRVVLRRLHFDIVGLPPSAAEVEAFEKACGGATIPAPLLEKTVDALLASPRFGERWGRHWLDLVRYGESRGHEFDYTAPNAYQYRDYVLRALNADVPYDQFVLEHLAGDLLPQPRRHPKLGWNESILGTGFWFLGEQVHSPVDTCQDKAERFDNMLDVMSKAFLGLTVACARCHDHKFDAISAKDYYALFGYLESSSYRLAPFDTMLEHQKLAAEIDEVRNRARGPIRDAWIESVRPSLERLADHLLAAREVIVERKAAAKVAAESRLEEPVLAAWVNHLRTTSLQNPRDPFHVWARHLAAPDAKLTAPAKRADTATPFGSVVVDYANCDHASRPPSHWIPDGVGFGLRPVWPGEARLGSDTSRPIVRFAEIAAAESDPIWDRVKPAPGVENDPGALGGSFRFNRTLCTPKFTVTTGKVHYLVKGAGRVFANVDGHVMLSGPLHGQTHRAVKTGEQFEWHTHDLTRYRGRRVHIEFTSATGVEFAVARVVQSDTPPPAALVPMPRLEAMLGRTSAETSPAALARSYEATFREALQALGGQANLSDLGESAVLANWVLRHPQLVTPTPARSLADAASPWLKRLSDLERGIQSQTQLAPAILDNIGVDEAVYIRGSYKAPGEPAPRRFLEALTPGEPRSRTAGSGRLELARQVVDPKRNPFVARVLVNRIWHHLFGRGLVASVDNFGVLGEAPSHPELLDHLADRFVREGWSIKKVIRDLVLTEAYRRSSKASDEAARIDPANVLLTHASLRRLEGEAIRDAMLAVSGRLDLTAFGPAVPVALTDFQQGRGRPASGPLDGNGRRSVYLAVRRNFLAPFLLAFDTPIPFSTVGRRTVSNVPAQALILLNDPFVHQQADVWAKRVLAGPGSTEDRVRGMYLSAYGRAPTRDEMHACVEFAQAGGASAWPGLAHVLFNAKEFIFLE